MTKGSVASVSRTISPLLRAIAAIILALTATAGLAACSGSGNVDMSTVTAVIDVRTPEETSSGHLEGALLYDIQGSDFASQVASLDPAGNYVVYCRSGNRAGQAIEYLQEQGFTGELTNGGGIDEAASLTGLSIVTD